MDKYQEALIYFCNGCHHEYEEGNYGQCKRVEGRCGHYKSLKEACDKARKYDKKETPKKTIKEPIIKDGYRQYKNYCPICKQEILMLWDYCSYCGQKLDCSDEDDK